MVWYLEVVFMKDIQVLSMENSEEYDWRAYLVNAQLRVLGRDGFPALMAQRIKH